MIRSTALCWQVLLCVALSVTLHAWRATRTATADDVKPDEGARAIVAQVVDEEGRPKADVPVRFHVDKQIEILNTDSAGEVRWKNLSPETSYVSVNVKVPGYMPMRAQWNKGLESAPLFERLAFRLEKGTRIGGRICDEQGKPIEGARVHLLVPTDPATENQPHVSLYDLVERSDADGKWTCDIIPADARNVWIRLEHDDYLSDRIYGSSKTPAIEALRAGTGTMTMRKGLPVSGTVVDADGHPVAGAIVAQGADRFGSEIATTKTDDEGKYRFSNCPPGPLVLTLAAEGWMPDLKRMNVVPDMGAVDFRLLRGKTVRVRVVDEQGKPVEGVWIAANTWRECRTLTDLGIPRSTNSDGVWQWTWAPDDVVQYDIMKEGFMDRRGDKFVARDDDYVVTLHRPLLVSGRVFDAKTKDPVAEFRVIPGIAWDSSERITWERRETTHGGDGSYRIRFTFPRFAHLVRVEANGYLPAVSRRFKDDEGAVTYDFALEKGAGMAGIVLLPDKKPAVGATLVVCPRGETIFVSNGSVQRQDLVTTRSDEAGKFTLPPQTEACDLLVMHEQGSRWIKGAGANADMRIEMEPWARLEGILKIGSKPAGGQSSEISLMTPMERGKPQFVFSYRTTTDDAGHFQFDQVQPGEGNVGRTITFGTTDRGSMSTQTHTVPVKLTAGKTTRVQIGGTGRPVIGRLTLPPGAPEVDWKLDIVNLREKSTPSLWDMLSNALGIAPARTINYACTIGTDGSFRMEDVPSGSYQVHVNVSAPPAANQCGTGEQIGYLMRNVSVPEMSGGASDEPLDLGALPIKVWKRLKIGDPAPDFAVKTLDGQTLRLADLRGKYVLVDFWATWCGPCRGELPHLKTVYERFGSQKQFVMVGLSSDRSDAPLRKYVDDNKILWSQALLGNDTPTTSDYGVRGIPSIFLIGPDGTVVAKDLRGPAMVEQLEKFLASTTESNASK